MTVANCEQVNPIDEVFTGYVGILISFDSPETFSDEACVAISHFLVLLLIGFDELLGKNRFLVALSGVPGHRSSLGWGLLSLDRRTQSGSLIFLQNRW